MGEHVGVYMGVYVGVYVGVPVGVPVGVSVGVPKVRPTTDLDLLLGQPLPRRVVRRLLEVP